MHFFRRLGDFSENSLKSGQISIHYLPLPGMIRNTDENAYLGLQCNNIINDP